MVMHPYLQATRTIKKGLVYFASIFKNCAIFMKETDNSNRVQRMYSSKAIVLVVVKARDEYYYQTIILQNERKS
jgi:hypothetical protein